MYCSKLFTKNATFQWCCDHLHQARKDITFIRQEKTSPSSGKKRVSFFAWWRWSQHHRNVAMKFVNNYACPIIKLVYHNHCYYDPQVVHNIPTHTSGSPPQICLKNVTIVWSKRCKRRQLPEFKMYHSTNSVAYGHMTLCVFLNSQSVSLRTVHWTASWLPLGDQSRYRCQGERWRAVCRHISSSGSHLTCHLGVYEEGREKERVCRRLKRKYV